MYDLNIPNTHPIHGCFTSIVTIVEVSASLKHKPNKTKPNQTTLRNHVRCFTFHDSIRLLKHILS